MEIVGPCVLLAIIGWMMGGRDAPVAQKYFGLLGKGIALGSPMILASFAGLFWLMGQPSPQCQNLPTGWVCPAPPLFTAETWGWIAIGGFIVTVIEVAVSFFFDWEWISLD